MKPEEAKKKINELAENMKQLLNHAVYVGITKETASSKVYGNGKNAAEIGAIHEYGAPNVGIPMRSFLRGPIKEKKAALNKVFDSQMKLMASGMIDWKTALNRVGIAAQNVSQLSFNSNGYGAWKDIKQSTKNKKGSSKILVDKGILKSSITYVIRKD